MEIENCNSENINNNSFIFHCTEEEYHKFLEISKDRNPINKILEKAKRLQRKKMNK